MDEEQRLIALAQDKLRAGILPRDQQERTWAGPGEGRACDMCGNRIVSEDTEYELQFHRPGAPLVVRFHRLCLAAWEAERRLGEGPQPPSPAPA
jgi:hypothetical protein